MDLFHLAKELAAYLRKEGVLFSEEGFPILTEDMLLKEMPDQVVPIDQAFAAKEREKTLLVSFSNDEYVYRRLFSLARDLSMYQSFLGFGGFDLSPRIGWDINLQKFNILLSRMADVFLALNGVKLIPNFRTGSGETMGILNCYPKGAWYIAGTLGCAKGHVKVNEFYLRMKLLITNPDMLLFYGLLRQEYKDILQEYGVPFRVYPDFQRISRGKEEALWRM